MNSIRAFIAVEIDPDAKQKVSELIDRLKKSNVDVKWVKEGQMHLTLKFLGNIEQDKIGLISDSLRFVAGKTSEFKINFSGIGAFPGIKRPRVIWLGIDKGAENLKTLAAQIEEKMEKIGFEKGVRAYKTHLTLGRVVSLKNIEGFAEFCGKTKFESSADIKINKIILFQSTLTPKGAIYSKLIELLFQTANV